MESIRQFLSFMNDISYPYAVLRNFENLPYDVSLGEHSDLDLLVQDYEHFFEIFPEAQKVFPLPRVRVRMPIADSYLYIDLRHVGDDYYPEEFERSLLKCREWNPKGFFTPDYDHHTAALAYHAVHHKNGVAPEYMKHLGPAKISELSEALMKSSIGWIEPKDPTVGRFNGYWKGATAVVIRENGVIVKKQSGYMQYPLIANESDILGRLKSVHFPKALRLLQLTGEPEIKSIEMEDCGDSLTVENLPENWRAQLREILSDLACHGVQHRDIKIDNLMVKDGIIKLIDFGWAATLAPRGGEFESLETAPPSCLGYPNRCPDGAFSDEFSMRRVVKQIEYQLEEQGVLA